MNCDGRHWNVLKTAIIEKFYAKNNKIIIIGMRPFWKSAIMQGLQPLQNRHFKLKIKIPKKHLRNHSASDLELFSSKNRWKKTKYSRKKHHFRKRQKLEYQETCQNQFYKSFRLVLCKKPLEKTLNIREMGPFWKSAIMQRQYIGFAKSSLRAKN